MRLNRYSFASRSFFHPGKVKRKPSKESGLMNLKKVVITSLTVLTLFGSLFQSIAPANAQLSGINIDFAAAEPLSYNHATGGGKWGGGVVNTDIERSLEGEQFACNDKVSYLTQIAAGDTLALQALGAMSLDLRYAFDLDTTGQSGIALTEPVSVEVTSADSGNSNDGGSSVSILETNNFGTIFTSNSRMFLKVRLTDLEANETVIIRTTVTLKCQFGSSPTGNLQAKFENAYLVFSNDATPVNPAEVINSGAKTVDLQKPNKVSNPELSISKTVTTQGGNCPGLESILIIPTATVRYCYLITNPSNSGGRIGAPLFNLSAIADDAGIYPDFSVEIMAGLSDIDLDGQIDDLAAGATATAYYEIAFDGGQDTTITNVASVSGFDASVGGNQITATDTATVFVDAPEGAPAIQIEKTPDTQVVVEGGRATFTITVTNTGNVLLSTIVVTDPLATECNKSEASLPVGGNITYTCSSDLLSAGFTNTATVTALGESIPVEDSDSATVTVDFLPKIDVTKEADLISVPESGGNVTYTVSVKNDAVEGFNLNSLVDDKFGDLNGVGTCSVPQSIASGATYTCSFTKMLNSEVLTPHLNTVTASGVDPESNPATDSDDASVAFTDVLPDISLTKVVNPTAAKWTGDYVDYTLTITNIGLETVTISAFADDKYTLSAECLALIGQTIAPSGSLSCVLLDQFVTGLAGGSFTNSATVTGVDNEANADTATASATVNFWWYGRTPGYWKNHPENWTSPFITSDFVQDVFTVPAVLLTSGNLDLDRAVGKDTLMAALSYKGGSTLSGGAQILLRAAVAALFNEAYYGADYPIATSTADLISQVNTTMATGSRSAYVTFASYLDYWNNAVHASLP